jgi:hypothetical protein
MDRPGGAKGAYAAGIEPSAPACALFDLSPPSGDEARAQAATNSPGHWVPGTRVAGAGSADLSARHG